MQTLTISQIQRNLHLLQDFDIIKVIDKRKHIVKGYFLSTKHKEEIEEIEKINKKQSLNNFIGIWKDKDIKQGDLRKKAWR